MNLSLNGVFFMSLGPIFGEQMELGRVVLAKALDSSHPLYKLAENLD